MTRRKSSGTLAGLFPMAGSAGGVLCAAASATGLAPFSGVLICAWRCAGARGLRHAAGALKVGFSNSEDMITPAPARRPAPLTAVVPLRFLIEQAPP